MGGARTSTCDAMRPTSTSSSTLIMTAGRSSPPPTSACAKSATAKSAPLHLGDALIGATTCELSSHEASSERVPRKPSELGCESAAVCALVSETRESDNARHTSYTAHCEPTLVSSVRHG